MSAITVTSRIICISIGEVIKSYDYLVMTDDIFGRLRITGAGGHSYLSFLIEASKKKETAPLR